ncbi:MAG: PadR family transcriptional regulator [Candidatus Bathyarchaeia archaeon]
MYGQNHRGHHGHGHHPGCGYHRRRGSLRTWVYSILQQAPKNGAEIINQIETASQGNWRPSPGSIYPLLDELCKEGSIAKQEDGRYEITDRGKQEFEWPYNTIARQPRSIEDVVGEMNSYLSYLEDLKRMDPTKITSNIAKLKTFRDRLTTVIDTS